MKLTKFRVKCVRNDNDREIALFVFAVDESSAKRVAEYSLSCGTFGVPFRAVEAVAVSA